MDHVLPKVRRAAIKRVVKSVQRNGEHTADLSRLVRSERNLPEQYPETKSDLEAFVAAIGKAYDALANVLTLIGSCPF